MATYLHKLTATGKYVNRVEWNGVSTFPVPAGHTRELETGANRAQAAADLAEAVAAELAASQSGLRDAARAFLVGDPRPEMKAMRALALVTLAELNVVRDWITDFKAQVALSSSLADLKTRVASLPATPDRTSTQLLNAMLAELAAGNAD